LACAFTWLYYVPLERFTDYLLIIQGLFTSDSPFSLRVSAVCVDMSILCHKNGLLIIYILSPFLLALFGEWLVALLRKETCSHDFPIYLTNMLTWLSYLPHKWFTNGLLTISPFSWHTTSFSVGTFRQMCWHDFPTGWRRLIGSPKSQIIFHKRATKYRSLLRKMTYKDKGSYESSSPCIYHTNGWLMVCWLFPLSVGEFWHVHSNAVYERDAGYNRQFVHKHGLYSRTQVCLSKYMCMLVGVCVCLWVFVCACMWMYVLMYIYVHTYIYTYTYKHTHMHVYICIYIHIYIYVYICTYNICIDVYIDVYLYIYTHEWYKCKRVQWIYKYMYKYIHNKNTYLYICVYIHMK